LKVGDQVAFQHDIKLVSIAAQRQLTEEGAIKAIRYDVRSLTLVAPTGSERTFVLAPECLVKLGAQSVNFDDLRGGDKVEVTFREPDAASQGYVQRVLRDKWTEEDVARELRRSPEYRNQGR